MIIECDNCATRFRLDDTRVTGGGVKVRCTKCENVFIVTPQKKAPEAPAPASVEAAAPAPAEAPEAEEPGLSIKIPQEEEPLKSEPQEESPKTGGDETEEYDIPKLSFGELDTLSPNTDGPGGPGENIEEILDSVYKDEFDTPEAAAGKDSGEKNGWPDPTEVTFNEEELLGGEEPTEIEKLENIPERTPDDTPDSTPGNTPDNTDAKADFLGILNETVASGEVKSPEAPETNEPESTSGPRTPVPDISHNLGPNIETRPGRPDAVPRAGEKVRPKPAASPLTGIIIAALIFVGGGALIYFSGIIDTLSGIFVSTASGQSVKIDGLSGSFVDNSSFGKVFVVKAQLNNITGEPQLVNGVRVTVYDGSGVAIEERTVPAGRVVSAEDIRMLPKNELMKRFNDTSGAMLPPKGSIPVIVPFASTGRAIAEYGIDVLR